MSSAPTTNLPIRSNTDEDDAIGGSDDVSETTRLFQERLQAWKHACGYLEEYITATEKSFTAQSKEFDKNILKTVNAPLREGEHFTQAQGGLSEMFDSIRTTTQNLSANYAESAKSLKTTVLPIFERLHNDIKTKSKDLTKTTGKSTKNLDKARAATQKHIELLGHHSAAFEHSGGKPDSSNDPYVIHRGIYHRLDKQLSEEKNSRADIIQVQNSFAQFEKTIVQTFQQGMAALYQVLGPSLDQSKQLYGTMTQNAQLVPADYEWNGFVQRNNHILIDPRAPERTLSGMTFPNQNHHSTKALCQGSLERKSGMLRSFSAAYYAITPAKYLHEFKSDDDTSRDPVPETSLYLPDCTVGGLNGNLFSVKGKDVSGNKLGAAMTASREFEFRAHNSKDAETWWSVIRGCAAKGPVTAGDASPGAVNPAESRNVSGTFGSQPVSPAVNSPTSPPLAQTQIPAVGTAATAVPAAVPASAAQHAATSAATNAPPHLSTA